MTQPVIVAAKRSPIGAFQGGLSSLRSPEIAGAVIKGLAGTTDAVDEVIMGCVLSAGVGQAPARQAAICGGLSPEIPTTTVNKVCGSGMKALMIASDQIKLGHAHSILAGGMESMTNAPYLLPKGRGGYRFGHGEVLDHMLFDGLEDGYGNGNVVFRQAMGCFADATAEKYGFSRGDQETFARITFENYQKAAQDSAFVDEIVPIIIGETIISTDEQPSRVKVDKFEKLRPAFSKEGTVTAATSSSLADGAAVLHVMDHSHAEKLNLAPLARICGYASHAHEPKWFTTAPVGAIQKLLTQTGWSLSDVDLFEINEAFAVVPMAAIKDLGIDRAKVNINGGACALGHPIGASGARIVVTLIHALKARGLKKGIAAACIGGGEATAMAIEVV